MIQRRRPAPSSGPGLGFASPAPPPPSNTNANTAYQPLRHEAVSTPPRFGQAPAFTPRANHVHSGSSFGGGLGGFSPMLGAARGTTGLGQYVDEGESGPVLRRVARQVRAGARDMAELNRSWSLVWG